MDCALSLAGVDKHYGAVHALRALDLELAPGEVLTVIGPSGCGKSTLLRLVAGLERPDAGAITIAGEVVADRRSWVPPERRRAGLVFQDHALFPHLDVQRNVAFGLHDRPRSERRARVRELLELVGLGHLERRHPHELSGGEQQRVALARALAPHPAIVLLDEPFSSLDENLRARVRTDTLAVLRATGSSAIIVTHDQDEALSLGDRIAVMREGVVAQVGTPDVVYRSPVSRFVATFMGEADFLPARVRDGSLTSEIGDVSAVDGWEDADAEVEVMLRPHEVALAPDDRSASVVSRVEYHGAFVLHEVRLHSGRTLRSWQQHGAPHPVGARVAVSLVADARPVLLRGDTAVTVPPALPTA
jgi:iron(III) transport system ATP-binding protein